MDKKFEFPKGFLWGAATSAHQVEGNNHNDWTEWEKANAERLCKESGKKYPPKNYISGRACDHYNRFREDFDIAKSLGHNAHRFSIEWSRIEPEEGKFDEKEIEHYREVIQVLRERGIEPFITVWHWPIPLWLRKKGGVLSKDFPRYFERYAEKLGQAFRDDIRYWITLNEPGIYALNGYLRGIWPPDRRGIIFYYRCIAKLIQAHRRSYKILKQIRPDFEVGIAVNLTYFQSAGGIVNDILKKIMDGIWNFHFLNHIRGGFDFIGFNYYFRSRINYGINKNSNLEISDMGWDIFPEGIYHALKDLGRYHKPIYITENGIADANDTKREKFIREHIQWLAKALAEGINVCGYFYWSLLDNFEWDKGFWPRFGLVEIDYETLERKPRPSSLVYAEIAKTNSINEITKGGAEE